MATQAEILALAAASQNFVPAAEEARQYTFLTLAPTTSASYPTAPLKSTISPPAKVDTVDDTKVDSTDAAAVIPAVPTADGAEPLKTRRSSSLSSEGSSGAAKKRFLKLGPVHFGEGDGDWSEDVLAE